jgi:DNA replication initiation complex subunit (GINS family)
MGQELELPLWVAHHLVQMGYARFREEDQLTLNMLSTTHYRETLPASRQVPKLSRSFYFQIRRLIRDLRSQEAKDRNKARDLDKALALARDIVGIRVKKIASLGASGEQTSELTSNLTAEELALYEKIRNAVDTWKKDILGREHTS